MSFFLTMTYVLFLYHELFESNTREMMKWNVGVESMEWCEEIEEMEMGMCDMRDVTEGSFEM